MAQKALEWHQPVLLREIIEYLQPQKNKRYLDATLGGGGYSYEIYRQGGLVLSLDWDPVIIDLAKKRYSCPSASWQLRVGNFAQLEMICRDDNFCPLDGVIFDLGLSKMHYQLQRGFSFQEAAPLDMRLNPHLEETASDLIRRLPVEDLAASLERLSQENYSREIAQALKKAVRGKKSAREIAQKIAAVYQRHNKRTKLHPATKTFLALRIMVNHEEENLGSGLAAALRALAPHGRLLIVSFHSGEDRIVKTFFRRQEELGKLKILTRQPVYPSGQELKINRLSRSAKLRVAEKP